jgi:hypothetical protein
VVVPSIATALLGAAVATAGVKLRHVKVGTSDSHKIITIQCKSEQKCIGFS